MYSRTLPPFGPVMDEISVESVPSKSRNIKRGGRGETMLKLQNQQKKKIGIKKKTP